MNDRILDWLADHIWIVKTVALAVFFAYGAFLSTVPWWLAGVCLVWLGWRDLRRIERAVDAGAGRNRFEVPL